MTLDYLGRLYIEKADYAKAEPLLQEALYAASGRDLVRDLQPPKDHQVVLLANPEFDKELAGTAQVAKGLEIV